MVEMEEEQLFAQTSTISSQDFEKSGSVEIKTYSNSAFMDSSEDEESPSPVQIHDPLSLVIRWLDFDAPKFPEKIVEHLHNDEILEALLDQIVLVDESIKIPSSYKKGEELPYRARDYNDPTITKRSYLAMELLSSNSKPVNQLLQSKFRFILVKLFEIFNYQSNGNFHHFRKLFESLLRFKPIEVLDILLLPQGDDIPLALKMLEFLDESPISASFGTILFFPLRLTVVEAERKRKLGHFLKTQQFIKRIVLRMAYSDNNSSAASDFLFRIIDECTRVESSEVITSCMEDPNDSLVDWVFEVLLKRSSSMKNTQKASCFKVLNALLSKSAVKEFEVAVSNGTYYGQTTQKTPNGLADIHELTRAKIIDKFTRISELLLEESTKSLSSSLKFGKYNVTHGFPSMRLGALEVMYEAIKELEDLTEPLDNIPAFLWKLMIDWFFQYEYNSVYHAVFYKLVVTVIKSRHVPCMKNLLSKTKFVTRMIEHYLENPQSGCAGYIILISNVLRLSFDSQKLSDYLPTMLSSHHLWQQFLPKLRELTLAQVEQGFEDDPSFQRPLPHVGPLSIPQESDEMMFLARILKAGDIDLGSQYAYSLGFVGNYPDDDDDDDDFSDFGGDDAKKKNKNKKKKEKRKKALQKKQNGFGHVNGDSNN